MDNLRSAVLPYDVGVIQSARANYQFRVTVDTNTYSVPAEYAGAALTLKLYPDLLCLYHQDRLIARHVRSYDRRRDFEHPDHPKALLQQRRRARDQKLLPRLLSLTPKAERFYQGLDKRRLIVAQRINLSSHLGEPRRPVVPPPPAKSPRPPHNQIGRFTAFSDRRRHFGSFAFS